ncbi:MAG TPA: hypothetical protein VHF22_10535, partial [Planctomycetota bacterium]|nr:hypothetical protein [Planctomycetota bacterium]
ARAADDARATASLARGLAGLLKVQLPGVEAFRDFARAYAARPKLWTGLWANAALAALEAAAPPLAASLPAAPGSLDEGFTFALIEALRARKRALPAL